MGHSKTVDLIQLTYYLLFGVGQIRNRHYSIVHRIRPFHYNDVLNSRLYRLSDPSPRCLAHGRIENVPIGCPNAKSPNPMDHQEDSCQII